MLPAPRRGTGRSRRSLLTEQAGSIPVVRSSCRPEARAWPGVSGESVSSLTRRQAALPAYLDEQTWARKVAVCSSAWEVRSTENRVNILSGLAGWSRSSPCHFPSEGRTSTPRWQEQKFYQFVDHNR